jgi:hypothetical protein
MCNSFKIFIFSQLLCHCTGLLAAMYQVLCLQIWLLVALMKQPKLKKNVKNLHLSNTVYFNIQEEDLFV